MIDARELRIGNIVNANGVQIAVDFINVDFGFPEKYLINDWYEEDLEPIPLTEQWLIKLGFEHTNDVNKSLSKVASNHVMLLSSIGKKYVVEIRNVMMSGSIMLQFSVTCVHQLQNLYWILSGKELEITN